MCLLPDTAHKTDNCITISGKWIFDYNLEFELPLTRASIDFICSGKDTYDITFVGIMQDSIGGTDPIACIIPTNVIS